MSLLPNTIYNESCIDTMARMAGNSIPLVVTSPPYDGLREYHGYSFDFEGVAKSLYRVLSPGGVIVWVVGDQTVKGSESGTSFRQALYFKELGLNLHDTMIYRKLNPIPLSHNRYEQEFEYMFILSKGKPGVFNPVRIPCKLGGRGNGKRTFYKTANQDRPSSDNDLGAGVIGSHKPKGNVWDIMVPQGVKGHPAQFPLPLIIDHILSWSNPGQTVYDPFMGAGTTAIAALETGRYFIGSEISETYVNLSLERIRKYQGK